MKKGDKIRLLSVKEQPRTRYTKGNQAYGSDFGIVEGVYKNDNKQVEVSWYKSNGEICSNYIAYFKGTTIECVLIDLYDINEIEENLTKLEKRYE